MGNAIERAHAEHGRVLRALKRLDEALAPSPTGKPPSRNDLVAAVRAFLTLFEKEIEPHMATEERDLYPELGRHLPREVGSVEEMLRDHETARTLSASLNQAAVRLSAGTAEPEEVIVYARDLTLLLREHIRKEDGVVFPLATTLRGGTKRD